MKIVNRKDFLNLPAETMWSYYEPCVFRGLYIKVSDLNSGYSNDFLYDDLIGAVENTGSDDWTDKLHLMEHERLSYPVDFDYTGREGLFDDGQLFAIYEKEDVEKLIQRLSVVIKNENTL